MGLFRRRKSFVTKEDVISAVRDGPPVWEEVFGADFSPSEQQAVELAFGESAISVIRYLTNTSATPTNYLMSLSVFGNVIAKAEFNLRYRPEFDHSAVKGWLADQLSSVDLTRLPEGPPLPAREELIAEACQLISDGWEAICTLACAYMASSFDVEGRELDFLHSFFGDPSTYLREDAEPTME